MTTLVPAPGVRAARCGDEIVLLDASSARLHVLDDASALLWSCFDGDATVEEIVEDVADAFACDVEDARAFVDALVAQLVSRGVLVSVPSPSASLART